MDIKKIGREFLRLDIWNMVLQMDGLVYYYTVSRMMFMLIPNQLQSCVAHGARVIVPYMRGYGATSFLSDDVIRSGEQAAFGSDLLSFMNALNIKSAVLGGYDWGGRAACVVSALWPEQVTALVSGNSYNIQNISKSRNQPNQSRGGILVPILLS